MAAAGWNLQTYIDAFLRGAKRWSAQRALPFDVAENDLLFYLNEALRTIQARKGIVQTLTKINLLSTSLHDIPAAIMGFRINRIEMESATSTATTILDQRSYDYARAHYDFDTPVQGIPVDWAFAKDNQRQIYILPPAQTAKTNGLHIWAELLPAPIFRLYQSQAVDGYTATATNGSNSVALSNGAPVSTGKILAGDDFGIVPTTASDGSTVTGLTPTLWYRITVASGSTLTLAESYAQPTATAQPFITAHVSSLETAFPGEMGFLPVDMALKSFYETSTNQAEPVSALVNRLDAKAEGAMARLNPQERKVISASYRTAVFTPFHRK